MKTVVIGLLGVQLDQPRRGRDRWSGWRPSVAITQQDHLIVDRFELLFDPRFGKLANQVAEDIETVSPETEIRRHEIPTGDPWDFEEVYAALHQFTRDYPFDVDSEDYLVHITTGTHVAQICLFLLTESRHLPARLLQSSPPKGREGKRNPTTSEEAARVEGTIQIVDLDLSRYDQLATRFAEEHEEARSILKRGIATRDADFNRLIDQIERVTLATDAPVLLSGPTGAGKTQLAKRIYELKRNRRKVDGPLVEINCATIRGEQAMSTLFGHTKGAFTGATNARPGLLRTADAGMLFLDEIGELGLDEQAMLLRAIEEKRFLPVGADESVSSDFQLIAGTNRDLSREVSAGRFREDLLSRINLWSFRLPGLAERRPDIAPNLDYELQEYARRTGDSVTINREARDCFLAFALDHSTPWKANFRDLNAAVVRMATLSESGRIQLQNVKDEIVRLRQQWDGTSTSRNDLLEQIMGEDTLNKLDAFDQAQLAEVLRVCAASKSLAEAGRKLFSVSRLSKSKPNDSDRVRKYLARFDVSWNDIHRKEAD